MALVESVYEHTCSLRRWDVGLAIVGAGFLLSYFSGIVWGCPENFKDLPTYWIGLAKPATLLGAALIVFGFFLCNLPGLKRFAKRLGDRAQRYDILPIDFDIRFMNFSILAVRTSCRKN